MKTIKIIDLLVKMANGEEVPNKIRFNNIKWNRVYGEKNVYYINEYDSDFFLYFFRKNLDFTLNDEVEITEEDKKIEKLDLQYKDITKGINFEEQILSYCDNLQYKINEIIDYINKEEK